ncbi:hypothetical protein FOPG_19313 [Fusarium oxysporum f. sp. conglutinans race 2 54008]|uniref:Uncharacterized protein n=1 Tax=Fusarium oxysporum f. sp. conglutinans race 2 54008 TaxID=1089457 RepID=X0GMB8_FUSOX|nr:hypothetical protein FOPG_19313 [Fusarium oxysporum f. sp. conglutinans race 2 54008]
MNARWVCHSSYALLSRQHLRMLTSNGSYRAATAQTSSRSCVSTTPGQGLVSS